MSASNIIQPQDERTFRDRQRSRSPGGYRRGGYPPGPPDDFEYGRRGPPRGYSPRREDYRRRSPPPRDYYNRYDRSPPRGGPRGPPDDGYPPARRYGDESYGGLPPRNGGRPYDDQYMNGHGGGYGHGGRPPYDGPPRGRRSPPGRPPYDAGYDRSRHW
jgi:transcription initiation factor TFIID subunit 15